MNDIIRRVRIQPYMRGHGPVYTLVMRDSGTTDSRGQTGIDCRLTAREVGKTTVIATGRVFGSPMHADDSDATVVAAINLLTMSDDAPEAAREAAEYLSAELESRFGGDR